MHIFQQLREVRIALDAAFNNALSKSAKSYNFLSDRYIILSDLHRGTRNGADDFRRTEMAYNAALAYYFRKGYTLALLGDIEELWEEKSRNVLNAYRHTYELESQFHRDHRYIRIWGNHDDEWQYKDQVTEMLGPIYGSTCPLEVRESAIINIENGSQPGQFFLIHGHQGDCISDKLSPFSRIFVRHCWRPFQRLTNFSLNTPAKDWNLRNIHDIAMYRWASRKKNLILIAGHTHRPVFGSKSYEIQIRERLSDLEKKPQARTNQKLIEEQSRLAAKLEWIKARENPVSQDSREFPMKKPCYFNTGCGCFLDGDITGIEIANGNINLVRWPNDDDEPCPQTLASDSLERILANC